MSDEKDRTKILVALSRLAEDTVEKEDISDRDFCSILVTALERNVVTKSMLSVSFCASTRDVSEWANGRTESIPPSCSKSDVLQFIAWHAAEKSRRTSESA